MSTTTKRQDKVKDGKRKEKRGNKESRSSLKNSHEKKKGVTANDIDKLVDAKLSKILGKNQGHLAIEQQFNVQLPRRPTVSQKDKIDFLLTGVQVYLKGSGTLKERKSLLGKQQLNEFQSFLKSISTFLFGTQEPVLKIPSSATALTAASGIIDVARNIGWGALNNSIVGGLAACFDEVKVENGTFECVIEINTYNFGSGVSAPTVVGIIDYSDATVMASFTAGLCYDSNKLFSQASLANGHTTEWKWKSQGIPDLSWIDTSDTSTMVAYWKAVNRVIGVSNNNTYGFTHFHAWCRFRQMTIV